MEKTMELKELTDKTLELFGVKSPEQLGSALLAACGDPDKLRSFTLHQFLPLVKERCMMKV